MRRRAAADQRPRWNAALVPYSPARLTANTTAPTRAATLVRAARIRATPAGTDSTKAAWCSRPRSLGLIGLVGSGGAGLGMPECGPTITLLSTALCGNGGWPLAERDGQRHLARYNNRGRARMRRGAVDTGFVSS